MRQTVLAHRRDAFEQRHAAPIVAAPVVTLSQAARSTDVCIPLPRLLVTAQRLENTVTAQQTVARRHQLGTALGNSLRRSRRPIQEQERDSRPQVLDTHVAFVENYRYFCRKPTLRNEQRAVAIAEETEVVRQGIVVDSAPIAVHKRTHKQEQRALRLVEIGHQRLH